MTFRSQLQLTAIVGAVALAVFALSVNLNGTTNGALAQTSAAIVAVCLMFGILGRSGHRWLWLNVLSKEEGPTRQKNFYAFVGNPVTGVFWRWWMHIDRDGKDKD